MTKAEILAYFQDINAAYNECGRYDDLKRMLDELTEEKTGKWIYHDDPFFDYYTCSECGLMSATKDNYCYDCGAKMEEEKCE